MLLLCPPHDMLQYLGWRALALSPLESVGQLGPEPADQRLLFVYLMLTCSSAF